MLLLLLPLPSSTCGTACLVQALAVELLDLTDTIRLNGPHASATRR